MKMKLLLHTYLLCLTVIMVESFQPNCDKNNQFLHYCFPITFCSSYDCDSDECGRFNSNSETVLVNFTKIIPRCAFTNSNQLRYIFAVNKNIEVVASRSFVNLSNVDIIDLSFNVIKQLHINTFNNVSATFLDLSWNKLVYIEDGAFHGLHNLRYLNLSKNELSTLSIHQMPLLLTELKLSFNLFNRILLTSGSMPNLTDIDLSNNVLKKVALNFENPMKKIDLSQNLLSKIDFMDIFYCEELKISSNLFSSVPEYLRYLSLEKVFLYPNPWKCDELNYLWGALQNNLVTVLDDTSEQTFPICVASEEATSRILPSFEKFVKHCTNDEHCDKNMICRNMICLDPCKENACDPTSECITINHIFSCNCPRNKRRDPRKPHSPCIHAECFVKKDCFSSSTYCSSERKCIRFNHAGFDIDVYGDGGNATPMPVPASGVIDTHDEDEMWWINEIPKSSPTLKGENPKCTQGSYDWKGVMKCHRFHRASCFRHWRRPIIEIRCDQWRRRAKFELQ